jgi:NAD(P)-dependent dehydrogenase (short-subunit alcohol dehydrogenase family)
MKARGCGAIVNISSGSAKVGLPMRLPYVVSKAAVSSMSLNLARELGPFGIRVNAILPGPIRGPRMERIISEKAKALGINRDDYEARLVQYTSLRCLMEPEDIANAVVFLASSGGARISGQLLGIDGNLEWEE